jgi:hypothetical protein
MAASVGIWWHSLNVEHANLERNWDARTQVMNAFIRALVPKLLRPRLRGAYNYVRHKLFLSSLFGHYASLIPPLELMQDGPVDLKSLKQTTKNFFATTRSSSAVSNLMRGSLMLVRHWKKDIFIDGLSNDQGSYEGLDIVK